MITLSNPIALSVMKDYFYILEHASNAELSHFSAEVDDGHAALLASFKGNAMYPPVTTTIRLFRAEHIEIAKVQANDLNLLFGLTHLANS